MAQIEVSLHVVAALAAASAERAGALMRLSRVAVPEMSWPMESTRAVARLADRLEVRLRELAGAHDDLRAGLAEGRERYLELEDA